MRERDLEKENRWDGRRRCLSNGYERSELAKSWSFRVLGQLVEMKNQNMGAWRGSNGRRVWRGHEEGNGRLAGDNEHEDAVEMQVPIQTWARSHPLTAVIGKVSIEQAPKIAHHRSLMQALNSEKDKRGVSTLTVHSLRPLICQFLKGGDVLSCSTWRKRHSSAAAEKEVACQVTS